MEIRHLQTFQIVVEEQNLIQAAMRLNYSQPTVSKHLQQLEDEIGLPLFERVDNRKKLTKSGEILYEHSKNILNELFTLQRKMEESKGEKQIIRVCGLDEYCDRFLLPQIVNVKKKDQNVSIEVYCVNSSDDALKKVILNEMDFAIINERPLNSDISSQCIDYNNLVLFASSDVANDTSQTENYIAKYPVLVDQRVPLIKFEILKKRAHFPNTIHCNSDEAIKNGVLNRQCLGIIGTNRIKKEIESGAVTILETYSSNMQVKLIALTKTLSNPIFQDFYTSIINACRRDATTR
ncbi:LysR family transcriptional regulator [Psychrobacillus sp. NPDC058041]|uniref:LysR family transcriptional regulator n=1 Tax=Psychrobacillus sp. NPDC058041 TaxID=3346310 RepID=UPI0036DF0FE3